MIRHRGDETLGLIRRLSNSPPLLIPTPYATMNNTPYHRSHITRGQRLSVLNRITALLGTLLSGCVTATVTGPATLAREVIPPELAHEYPAVVVEGGDSSQQVGHLFAFLALPVGTIVVNEPKRLIEDSITRAIIAAGDTLRVGQLRIRGTQLYITAYDLVVTRHIRCSVASTIEVSNLAGASGIQTVPVATSLSRFRSLAFSPQISEVARECLRQFGAEVLRKIDARMQMRHHP